MVEMAAATAILLITAAVLLSLLLGMPWWMQAAGVLLAVAGLTRVSRWLVRETLGRRAPAASLADAAIDFDYLDGEGKLRHCVVDVGRIRDHYFEGVSLDNGMAGIFFLARVKGPIRDRCSGETLPPKAWALSRRIDTLDSVVTDA